MSIHPHPSPPVATARTPLYGWVIVVIAALAMIATLPGRTHGLGMITERLLVDDAFQLDRVSYSDLNLWATLLGGLFCLPCGWLIDRFGLRVNLTLTVLALGAVVVWMTQLSGTPLLFVAILLTRGIGQSMLSVISITMVGKWFPNRLSLPMAIYSLLLSLGFAFAMQFAKPFSDQDWRVLWGGMGWILLVGFAPISLLLTRDPVNSLTTVVSEAVQQPGFTLIQAMRTPTFWVFGIAISVIALMGSGISLFNESVLKQQGFDKTVFYDLVTFTGIVGLATQLPVGWLGQRVPLNWLLAFGLILQTACLYSLPFIHTTSGLYLYGTGMGIAGATTTIMFFTVWGAAFGRAHLGKIQSISQMMTVVASAAGPKVFAECFARFGSYALAFHVLSGTLLALAVAACLIRVPRPEDAAVPEVEPALATQ